MNAFDRYPLGEARQRRRLPSHRRSRPVEIQDYERRRARGVLTLIVFLGTIAAAYAMIFIVGRAILAHQRLAHPPAASVAMPPATHALTPATVVEAGRRSPPNPENAR